MIDWIVLSRRLKKGFKCLRTQEPAFEYVEHSRALGSVVSDQRRQNIGVYFDLRAKILFSELSAKIREAWMSIRSLMTLGP